MAEPGSIACIVSRVSSSSQMEIGTLESKAESS
jgi:hypothetical protein